MNRRTRVGPSLRTVVVHVSASSKLSKALSGNSGQDSTGTGHLGTRLRMSCKDYLKNELPERNRRDYVSEGSADTYRSRVALKRCARSDARSAAGCRATASKAGAVHFRKIGPGGVLDLVRKPNRTPPSALRIYAPCDEVFVQLRLLRNFT